jgi:hypothetical protein
MTRTRRLVTLAWTAALIVALVTLEYAVSRPSGGCGPNADAYCAFGAAADEGVTGDLEVGAFFLAVVVWALGLGVIRFVGWLVDVAAARRERRAIAAGKS